MSEQKFIGYADRQKRQQLINEKRKQQKSDERKIILRILAIFSLFILALLSNEPNISNSEDQEQSCEEKHKQDYQAFLLCQRIKNGVFEK